MILVCFFLMTVVAQHFFLVFFLGGHLCIFLCEVFMPVFSHFPIALFVFLLTNYRSQLYILSTSPLLDICLLIFFSILWTCLLIFWMISFEKQTFNFKYNLLNFSFVFIAFSILRNPFLLSCHENIILLGCFLLDAIYL